MESNRNPSGLMRRIFYITVALALLGACGFILFHAERRSRTDPELEAVLNGPTAVDRFGGSGDTILITVLDSEGPGK
jgi:hypothetical protein